MEYLSKVILEKPRPTSIKNVNIKKQTFVVNDEIYKVDFSARGWLSWSIGIMLLFFALMVFSSKNSDDFWAKIIFLLIFGLSGIFGIIYGFVAPKKYLIYHRYKDTITVTRVFRKSVNIPFSTGYGVRVYTVSEDIIRDQLSFVSDKKKPRVGGIVAHNLVDENWALMVWYMDKNRPLPPGTAFDPYRQKDFERRKAAGFPKPLFPSKIATPEATPEQQAERMRIGGW